MAAQNSLPPLPSPNVALTAPANPIAAGAQGGQSAQVSVPHSQWLSAVDNFLRTGNFPTTLSAGGNQVLTVAGGATLTGGFNEKPFDFGSVTSGSITPNPSKCLKQKATNNGAFTIAATAEIGDLELLITNGASAGAVSFSGFTKQFAGDSLDTTSGHRFVVLIYAFDAGVTAYVIKALQ